jgi:hypothetical protein
MIVLLLFVLFITAGLFFISGCGTYLDGVDRIGRLKTDNSFILQYTGKNMFALASDITFNRFLFDKKYTQYVKEEAELLLFERASFGYRKMLFSFLSIFMLFFLTMFVVNN